MKRTLFCLALVAAGIVIQSEPHLFTLIVAAQTPKDQAEPVPLFQVDPTWPKVPSKWKLGDASSIGVDAQDRIWVLHRPRTLPADQASVAAPPVLVFDAEGNFIKAWGGAGNGYEWPQREHGIYIDSKGFVWIGGNNCPARNLPGLSPIADDQLLKFTQDGKFVMQIGHAGKSDGNADTNNLQQPADEFVYPKTNELFVADGYGNHRVAVLDGDTGEIKRIWGAYGNPPTDENLPTYNPDSPQFANPVHCIALGKDDFVYVCDRTNNRVQVFHKDGSFVRQFVFDPKTRGSGSSWGIAFSPRDKKQNYFVVIDGTNNVLDIVRRHDGAIVGTSGRPGRGAGEFHWVHVGTFDSRGNFYTGEVDTGKRLQKWVPVE